MFRSTIIVAILVSIVSSGVSAFGLNRRQVFKSAAASVLATGTFVAANPALAAITDETPRVTTRMGGLLEKYQDSNRGWAILAPSGWNKFDGEVGAYDVKWQDLVDPRDNIKVSSTPVKSTTTSM
jgi:PsbP